MFGVQKGKGMIHNIGQKSNAVFLGNICNSYLICGDKNIIVDTVPHEFAQDYICAIKNHISPDSIDAVILTSASPDKAGCVDEILKLNPELKVYATVAGLRNLKEILNSDFNGQMCKNLEEIIIGDNSFKFYITPNTPNPDSMMAYCQELDTLFSGEILASVTEDYYNKRLRMYMPFIKKAEEMVSSIAPGHICPSRGDTPSSCVINLNNDYDVSKAKVIIAYSSLTGSNDRIAKVINDALIRLGAKTDMVNLDCADPAKTAAGLYDADALVLGTYTQNRSMPEDVWSFISAVDVNSVSGKPYFVFGSYGWSCEGVYIANELLSLVKMNRVCKPVECIFTPNDDDFVKANDAANELIKALDKERKTYNA